MMLPPLFYLFLCCWMTLQVVWKEQWFGNLDAWVLNFVRVFVKCNVSNEERFSLSWWQRSVNPSHQGVWGQRFRRSTELQTSESTCFISVTRQVRTIWNMLWSCIVSWIIVCLLPVHSYCVDGGLLSNLSLHPEFIMGWSLYVFYQFITPATIELSSILPLHSSIPHRTRLVKTAAVTGIG